MSAFLQQTPTPSIQMLFSSNSSVCTALHQNKDRYYTYEGTPLNYLPLNSLFFSLSMEDYWRNQHQSDHQPPVKIPKQLLEPLQSQASEEGSALPLFVPEPSRITSNLSAFSDSTSTTSKFSRMKGLFSLTQWQELELQALIFKYMLAGAPVPTELVQPIQKSLLLKSPPLCYLNQPFQLYQHYQPAMLQSGYWGRSAIDPEPGRCRRTDGKKWRCSKDVVAGQKYCDRHMHRGRNRSRKPVEILTSTATAALPRTVVASGNQFTLNESSPLIDLHLNQRCPEPGNRSLLHNSENLHSEGKPDGQVLRHFFDDWPKSQEEPNGVSSKASPTTSTSFLSISIQGSNNPPSDFSLKLSTGIEDESSTQERNITSEQPQPNWGGGWNAHQMSSMGGPLAEALRASTSNSSPMSVLPNKSGSETSSIST